MSEGGWPNRPLLLIGAGGHARVLAEALLLAGARVLGCADPALPVGSTGPGGLAILGGDEVIAASDPARILLVNGIGSTGSLTLRARIFVQWEARGFAFAPVVHPAAIVSPSAHLGAGAQVMAGAVVGTGTTIGANSIVNTRASVDHDCRIGRSVHIAPGAVLSGGVRVGDETHLGTGAVVIQNIAIGRGCLVAAGAVIHRDLPDASRYIKPGGG